MPQAHTIGARLTDRHDAPPPDAQLALRATTADAITTVVGTFASPDYASSAVEIGNGSFHGRVRVYSFAPTLANADNFVRFVVQGYSDASGTIKAPLAELQIGRAWAGSASFADSATFPETSEIDIIFHNVLFGVRFPYVRLAVLCGGTATSFTTGTFGALITRLT